MPPVDESARTRTGRLLAARRIELGARYRNKNLFADERGLNRRMVWRMETGAPGNYRGDTFRAVESAYELVPGSLDRTLAGGELEPLPDVRLEPRPAAPLLFSDDDEPEDEWLAYLVKSDPVVRALWRLQDGDGRKRPAAERTELIRVFLKLRSESESRNGNGGHAESA